MSGVRHRWVDSGGVRLAVYERGDTSAPTVLLVHGYPDNHSVWDGVADHLSSRYHVVSYDVRGHGDSGEPAGRDGYRLGGLTDDLMAVARAVADRPVHLVGHDWGSIQGWAALDHDVFRSFTSISGPHLGHLGGWLRDWRRHPGAILNQLPRSWYIGAFQLPALPELVWRNTWLLGKFSADYRDARNGVRLYRANMGGAKPPPPRRVSTPVQQIALTEDPFVTAPLLDAAEAWCDRLYRRRLVAGHWAPRTHPAAVARMIGEFVDHVDGAPAARELVRVGAGKRDELDGQLALVTGAGSGIGRATAIALAGQGARVLCVDIDFEAARRTAGEIGGSAFQADVSDGPAMARLAEHVHDEHGVLDLLMANAGIAAFGDFLETSVEDWHRVLGTNLWGVVHTVRAFLPPMVERRQGGHLVITSSAAGFLAGPSISAYATTKAGVLMLAQCLAGELRPAGIGVSAICPGLVRTNIAATSWFAGAAGAELARRRARGVEFQRERGYPPERVAAAVLAAVRDNRLVVPATPDARIAAFGARFLPGTTRMVGRWLDEYARKRST